MSNDKKLLLVDDDEDFVEATKTLLEKHGYRVTTAHDGAAGLEQARADPPDLMILDVMMATKAEGFDVSRKIKTSPGLRGLPVILLTGIRKAMNLRFDFETDETWLPVKVVLEKPVPPETLLAEVERHLRD